MSKIQPNDPCWCGSGEKYKKCHKDADAQYDIFKKQGFIIPKRTILRKPFEIEGIREAGKLVRATFDMLAGKVVAGVSTEYINELVHNFTVEHGAIPAPLNYKGFPKSCCTSINNVICHGIPSKNEILKEGDIINVDITSILNNYFADSSQMFTIGAVSEKAQKLIDVAKECLYIGIDEVKPMRSVNEIGRKIEPHAKNHGYSVVRDLCGHGIGLKFHEDPEVVHYTDRAKGMLMVPGMVFTIEPMINEGVYSCKTLDDNWTVVTADNKLSAQWEHTVLVTETGYEILT